MSRKIDIQDGGVFIFVVLTIIYYPLHILGLDVVTATSRYLFIFGILTFMFSMAWTVMHRQKMKFYFPVILFIGWYLWTLLLINVVQESEFNYVSFPLVMRYTTLALGSMVICSGSVNRVSQQTVAAAICTGAALLILLSLISGELAMSLSGSGHRFGIDLVRNPNEMGMFLFLGTICAVFLLSRTVAEGLAKRSLFVGTIFVFFVGIIATGSRKSLVATMAFFLIIFLLRLTSRKLKKGQTIAAMLLVLVVGITSFSIVVSQTSMKERLEDSLEHETQAQDTEERLDGRGLFFVRAADIFKRHPITGVGIGRFKVVAGTGYASHSDYISILVGTGLVGFILYFGAYLALLISLLAKRKKVLSVEQLLDVHICLAGLVCILILSFGRWNYDHPATTAFIGLVIQAAYGHKSKSNS